jgi:RNA polymerase sigma-70 factor (ECF subfamily)
MRRLAMESGGEVELPVCEQAGFADREEQARERTVGLFLALREPLAYYLASLGADQAEAEEVVQEAFLRLFRHLAAGAPDNNLRGWVFRVAQNLVRDRRRGWHHRHVDRLEDRPDAAKASDPGATPEERLLQNERLSLVRTAFGALPERQRRCLHLRAQGLRYREIAEVLGVSLTTVADLVRDGLARLERVCYGE